MYIYSRKCPHCGKVFSRTFFNPRIRLGPGTRTCHRCKKQFTDGSREWASLTPEEKREFIFDGVGTLGVLAVVYFCIGLIEKTKGENELSPLMAAMVCWLGTCLLALAVTIPARWIRIKKSKQRLPCL